MDEAKKKVKRRVKLTFLNGDTRYAVKEDWKYWYCEGARYRKNNPAIVSAEKEAMQRKEKEDA
jgi:hypothetical protein